MPNQYASLSEIKAAAPDAIRASTSKYDAQILRLAGQVSRLIDEWTHRVFFPMTATRYFWGTGTRGLWVPDLVSITSIEYSDDDGQTYTSLTAADYLATAAGDINSSASISYLWLSTNGTLGAWPIGERSVKVAGVWGYTDDRAACWEATGDTVEDNPLTSGATTITVNDVDGLDQLGQAPRFQPGLLYRIESEYVEAGLAVDTVANTVPILRARNGTSAAQHARDTAISVWRPPEAVRQAVIVEATRNFQRANQGWGDGRGGVDGAEIFYQRQLDPATIALLSPYRIPAVR